MDEIKFKIATIKVASAAQIVLGRPVKGYWDALKSACATGEKDSDGDAVYLFSDLNTIVNGSYVDEQDAACVNTVLTSIGYFNPGRYDELIDAAAAAGSIWSKAVAAADAAAKTAKDAAKDAAAAKQAAEKAAADKAAALPAKQAADKALNEYLDDVPEYLNFDPFTKDHKRDIAKFIYDRDKAGKLDKPAAMRVAHDYVVNHYQEWIGYFSHYINEIPAEKDLPRDDDGEMIYSRRTWRDRIHKALTTRSFKAGIGYKIDLRDGIRIKGTDEQIVSVKVKKS